MRVSSLVLIAVLGVHRIPANIKTKSNLLLQHANIHKSSQLSRDVRHREAPLSRKGHRSPNPSPQRPLRRTADAPLSCPYQANAPACPWSAKPLSPWLNPPISAGTASMLPKYFADLVQMKHQDFLQSQMWLTVPSTLLSPRTRCK